MEMTIKICLIVIIVVFSSLVAGLVGFYYGADYGYQLGMWDFYQEMVSQAAQAAQGAQGGSGI